MRRQRREDWSKALAALLWLIWGVLPAVGQQVPGGSPSPRLLHAPPSRPLVLLPPLKPPAERRLIPLRLVPPLPPAQQPADPVVQSSTTASVPTSNIFQFPGVGEGNYGYDVVAIPPDANGDVGSTQYVQWVNLAFAVFEKQSGLLLYGPAAGNTLWQDLRNDPNLWPCAVTNDGDPIV